MITYNTHNLNSVSSLQNKPIYLSINLTLWLLKPILKKVYSHLYEIPGINIMAIGN